MKAAIEPGRAAEMIPDGAVLPVGGFMGVGSLLRLIDAILACGTGNLTVVGNDLCTPETGVGTPVEAGKRTIEIDGLRFLVEKPQRTRREREGAPRA